MWCCFLLLCLFTANIVFVFYLFTNNYSVHLSSYYLHCVIINTVSYTDHIFQSQFLFLTFYLVVPLRRPFSLCWWYSGKSTCRRTPILSYMDPPKLHVYQNKFADQTLACFPIGPWTLIGSERLSWRDYGSKLSTLASLCVLQPWMQRFRGAAHV